MATNHEGGNADVPASPEGDQERDDTVMGAYDWMDEQAKFIIADVSRDDAWIAVSLDDELLLSDWQ